MGSLISILVMSSSIQFTALTVVSVIFVLLTPFTKVEESFSIQAIHDFLSIGFPKVYERTHSWLVHSAEHFNCSLDTHLPKPSINYSYHRWDHQDFPGVVSRSFVGPAVIALLTLPFSFIPQAIEDKFYVQIAARINLALLVVAGFNSYANAVGKKFGSTTRRALIVLSLTQFHFLYYASRPLPNTFALILTLFATAFWIQKRFKRFIFLIALTVVIFRFETCLLFGWILLYELFVTKEMSLKKLFAVGIPSGLFALCVTIGFDSLIWGKWLWPEGDGVYFNIYLNKSHEWGTQHFLWYFYSAIPRSLLLSSIFVPFCTKRCFKSLFIISFLFIFTYSFLPHKELRFIIYVVPILNTCAANTVAIMVEKFEGTKPLPESWLGNIVLKRLGYQVPSDEEAEAADREREQKERQEEEESKERKKKKNKSKGDGAKQTPTQYDAITPYGSSLRRRGLGKHSYNGVEEQLDEQYSKITAAILEKHKSPSVDKKFGSAEENEEPPSLSCTFIIIFIVMGIHIWCNVGCTVYASLASWNNYPGGDAILWLNDQIKNNDLKQYRRQDIGVYISNLGAQTGVTRFLQLEGVTYDKSPAFSLIANKTVAGPLNRKLGKQLINRNIIHDFSAFKICYLILEKIDVPFLQQYCTSTSSSKSGANTGIEGVVCNFGDNTKNCRIMKVINGFNGIDLGLDSKNVVIKTTPMLWIFKCFK
ncbi:dol-P-Man:Man(7)GlcNAc(2)-PP-Dol alpha-1:6-mannosyltransferase-like protein [Leptotrombidium deliense]|uniref:Mannosyltransferase n=1 Tax=Leptotrombidium deliense TaxID=299467 RepID=A0A443SUN9_9ACAR|nr:dol-P-Man:Man(7)GlcNAc(2)-PP-Dol alpha-1:6-mannosyltransferase-like protein [Leptotrombidium deliense]